MTTQETQGMGEGYRILVAEDERTQMRQIRLRLENGGYEVVEASNGREASRIFQDNPDIRMVLTDLLMPEMDGFQLIEFIRATQSSYVYIIVLSILEDRDSIVRALALGADDYVCKPVFQEELLLRLEGGRRLLRLEGRDALVFALARLAASNTGESPYRLHRIREYSRLLSSAAAEAGLVSRRRAGEIADLSPLLDIGKVAVPSDIWSRRNHLTPAEEELIRQHPVTGAEVIRATADHTGAAGLEIAHDIIRHHHERWDGKGYPDGLRGEEIPVAARIVAVADAYETMTAGGNGGRLSPSQAAEEIWAGAGSLFDPALAVAFIGVSEKMADVCGRYRDAVLGGMAALGAVV